MYRDRTFLSVKERSLRSSNLKLQRAFRARKALRDCYALAENIAAADSGHQLRRAWESFIIKSRSVGHILKKQDAIHRPFLSEPMSERFVVWKSDPVFLLIEGERNSLLKEGVSTLNFGEGEDWSKVLALGRFLSAQMLATLILEWWEFEIGWLEDRAEGDRSLNKRKSARIKP